MQKDPQQLQGFRTQSYNESWCAETHGDSLYTRVTVQTLKAKMDQLKSIFNLSPFQERGKETYRFFSS